MEKFSLDNVVKSLEWRGATKKFDSSKKVSEKEFEKIMEILRLTPSSFGLQPWKFYVVRDEETRKKIVLVAWGQNQVVDASHLIVLCARKTMDEGYVNGFIEYNANALGESVESFEFYKKMILGSVSKLSKEKQFEWNKNQVYIALGSLMSACAAAGIDTCPMEGFSPEKVDEILGLKESEYASVLLCPVGYRAKDDGYFKRKKVRFERSKVFEEI